MRASGSQSNDQIDELKVLVKTVEQSLIQAHKTIAEIDARLAWSHNRRQQQASGVVPPRFSSPDITDSE